MTTDMHTDLTLEIEIVQEKIATQHFVIKSSGHDDVATGKAAARLRELHSLLAKLQAHLTEAEPLTTGRL